MMLEGPFSTITHNKLLCYNLILPADALSAEACNRGLTCEGRM
jgi:hypothetical protein